jgi:hypothetical protein
MVPEAWATMCVLTLFFGYRIPTLAELVTTILFLCDYVRDSIYRNNPSNLDEMKTNM